MELVTPCVRYRTSYLEALPEYHAEGRYLDRSAATFTAFVKRLVDGADAGNTPPGLVPQTTYWLVDRETYLGRLAIRHWLTEALLQSAGHIGYEIRPSMRGRGLGTRQLALGLEKARDLGLAQVLLTCYDDNTRSIRVIEANGGVRDVDHLIPGTNQVERRYWIDLAKSQA